MDGGAGPDARTVFNRLVEKAQYNYGHSGYTGTIAEKAGDSFRMIEVPKDFDEKQSSKARAVAYADHLMDVGDERVDDKWGPAGCIAFREKYARKDSYLFFGWASE